MRKKLLFSSALAVSLFFSLFVTQFSPVNAQAECEGEFQQCSSSQNILCCSGFSCSNQPGTGATWCVKACTTNDQCSSGQVCSSGQCISAPTPYPSVARIQGIRVDIDENAATAPVPPNGVESTITVKEEAGTTIGTYTVKTSQYATKIDGVDVNNAFSTDNTLKMGGRYTVSINTIAGYKVYYSLNSNNIRHQQGGDENYISEGGVDVMCTGAATDVAYCYKEGNSVTVNIPITYPKNADGSDYPNPYIDIFWKYVPIVTPTVPGPTIDITPDAITPTRTITATAILTPSPTLSPDCLKKPLGDADCDEDIDADDYKIWRCEYLNDGMCTDVLILPTGIIQTEKWANFNFQSGDTQVDFQDFESWRVNSESHEEGVTPPPEPTATLTPTAVATAIPTVTMTPSPVVTIAITPGDPTLTPTRIPSPTRTLTPTRTPTPTATPTVRPYNSRILFTSNRHGKNDIMVKELSGEERRLTSNAENDYEPQISGNGQKIVFTSYRDLNEEIYVMNSDGTNQVRLTDNTFIDMDPTINSTATKIAFATNRHGNYEIYMMDIDGGNLTRLTNAPGNDLQPDFSPDGNKIVFASMRDGNFEIYTLDLTKPNADPKLNYDPQRWTDIPAVDYEPAFHPTDSNKIIFSSNRATYYRIFTLTTERTATKRFPDVFRLNIIGNYTDLEPSYSSDGNQVIFRSNRQANYEIWVVNPDGSDHKRVTFNTESDIAPVFFPGVSLPSTPSNP